MIAWTNSEINQTLTLATGLVVAIGSVVGAVTTVIKLLHNNKNAMNLLAASSPDTTGLTEKVLQGSGAISTPTPTPEEKDKD
jgi:hypothetical protein